VTKLAWWSIAVTTTSSPGPTFARPQLPAARFIASVVPRTKSRQSASARPQKRATRARAAAYASVAALLSR
jgi:hypothetical protein